MKTKKTLNRYIAGFPKQWSDEILKCDGDFAKYLFAGEDLVNNCIWISLEEFSRWLKAGVIPEIDMPYKDYKKIVNYFRKVDLRKHRGKRMHTGVYNNL